VKHMFHFPSQSHYPAGLLTIANRTSSPVLLSRTLSRERIRSSLSFCDAPWVCSSVRSTP